MGNSRAEIEAQLNSLRNITSSDFSALALIDIRKHRIQWRYASGNINDRYKQMMVRPGQGLAGLVIRLGRHMVLDAAMPDVPLKRLEHPIMLAENLHSALAVPITIEREIHGVLLLGSRSIRTFTENEIMLTFGAAEKIALLLKMVQVDESGQSGKGIRR